MKSIRERETFKDIMERYYGNLTTLVDQIEVFCTERSQCYCRGCPFENDVKKECVMLKIKQIIQEKP